MSGITLLTGGTGFVGRQVLRALAAKGMQVRVVVRAGKQNQLAAFDGIEGVIATPDLFAEGADWWARACTGIDTVIHVAWYAEPGQYLQSSKNLDCLMGTLQLAKGAAQAGVRRFVGVGTCFEYETSNRMLSVNAPLAPSTPYASAKAAAFLALSQYLPSVGIEMAWCRLFYLYGEGEDARRLVKHLHYQLARGEPVELTSGSQVRDFLDVRKAGEMLVQSAMSDIQGAVNICSGVGITVRELAEKIADEYRRRDLLKFGARRENQMDPMFVVGFLGQELK